jgi:uncharacterized membrane protein YuzA (DUF378 family)
MVLGAGLVGSKGIRFDVGTSLLVLVTCEAALMGSGRLLQVGPLTVKMLLFLVAQIYVIFRLVAGERLKLSTVYILLSFTLLLCFGSMVGMLRNSSIGYIAEDVDPLLYVYMLCFVEMTMKTKKHLQYVVRIIKAATVLMSVGYVLFITLLITGAVSFGKFYAYLSSGSNAEFMFRGESGLFLYKGSIYIAVGLILFAFDKGRLSTFASAIAILGLLATGTRGFFFSLMAVLLVHALTGIGGIIIKIRYLIVPCAIVAMLLILASGSLIGKEDSDAVRTETAFQVLNHITPLSIIYGNGLGMGVESKPAHMENAYLEIFHKQGALGLLWWGSLFILLFTRYNKARRVHYLYAQPLLLSAIFVAFESLTNPYINNPIGCYVVLIAFTGLDVVSVGPSSTELSGQMELIIA